MIHEYELFQQAIPVLERLKQAGYEAYFVGGSVRDALLGKPIADVDIATSATPLEVKAIFHSTIDIGIEHGTVLVLEQGNGYEITTFRTEAEYEDFRHPSSVTFVRSLEEDLKRRDFTINALAIGLEDTLVDFFCGVEDLQQGIIRCVGEPLERFNEDALRMVRAVRFVSQLNFELDTKTKQAIYELRKNLKQVAVERIRVEWLKLLTGPARQQGIQFFVETKLYESCPLLEDKERELQQFANNTAVQLTAIQAWILWLYYMNVSEQEVSKWLKAWKCSNQEIEQTKQGLTALRERLTKKWDFDMAYRCLEEVALQIEPLLISIGGTTQIESMQEIYQQLPIRTVADIALNGNDIKQLLQLEKNGAVIGQALQSMKEAILAGTLKNNPKELKQFLLENFS